jgi:hypothetical protein
MSYADWPSGNVYAFRTAASSGELEHQVAVRDDDELVEPVYMSSRFFVTRLLSSVAHALQGHTTADFISGSQDRARIGLRVGV